MLRLWRISLRRLKAQSSKMMNLFLHCWKILKDKLQLLYQNNNTLINGVCIIFLHLRWLMLIRYAQISKIQVSSLMLGNFLKNWENKLKRHFCRNLLHKVREGNRFLWIWNGGKHIMINLALVLMEWAKLKWVMEVWREWRILRKVIECIVRILGKLKQSNVWFKLMFNLSAYHLWASTTGIIAATVGYWSLLTIQSESKENGSSLIVYLFLNFTHAQLSTAFSLNQVTQWASTA